LGGGAVTFGTILVAWTSSVMYFKVNVHFIKLNWEIAMRVRAGCAHETLNSTFQGLEGGLFLPAF